MERDWFGGIDYVFCKNFNSHAHVERDDPITITVDMGENFNSHAHVERDAAYSVTEPTLQKFQLTRSRGA